MCSSNRLLFLMDSICVLYEVGTESTSKVDNFDRSHPVVLHNVKVIYSDNNTTYIYIYI